MPLLFFLLPLQLTSFRFQAEPRRTKAGKRGAGGSGSEDDGGEPSSREPSTKKKRAGSCSPAGEQPVMLATPTNLQQRFKFLRAEDKTGAPPAVRQLLPVEGETTPQPPLASPGSARKRGGKSRARSDGKAPNPVTQSVVEFLQSPHAVQEAGDFVKNFWTSCKEINATAGSYVSILKEAVMFELLKRIAVLQGEVLRIFQVQFLVPMSKLTKQGVAEQAQAWDAMRQARPDAGLEILLARDKAIACLDEAFHNLPFVLFDPVSCAYLLAAQALMKTIDKTDKTTLLYFQVKALAQVCEPIKLAVCLQSCPPFPLNNSPTHARPTGRDPLSLRHLPSEPDHPRRVWRRGRPGPPDLAGPARHLRAGLLQAGDARVSPRLRVRRRAVQHQA